MGLVQISSASCLIGTSKSFKTKTKPNQNKTKQRMSTTHPPVIPITMTHQVPFRQPAITVPLNWSFAGAQQPNNNNNSSSNSINLLRKEQPQTYNSSFNKSRKRSASNEFNPAEQPTTSPLKSISSLPKRTKRTLPNSNPSLEADHGLNPKEDPTDLGTALVSLTKNELISLLHGLIQQKPELKPMIKSLLPPPSLESILLKLDEVEKQLVESIPNKRMNREEYIWNRVRVPLNSYVNDCLSCLELAAQTIENRCGSRAEGKPELSVIYGAVSDQLSLLSHLSLSISKIESLLPSLSTQPSNQNDHQDLNWNVSYPFQSILIPSLFQNWKNFIESIHKLIFIDRMIISESLIRKWFSLLDGLSSPHPISTTTTTTSSSSSSSTNHQLDSHQSIFGTHPHPQNTDQHDNHTVQRLMIAVRDEALNRFGVLVGLKR
ncbi:hypothetical protein PGTUg99_011504 [Puccinia graminis f. sp. tritici]|nr:hypothetical protein PGTUg99_011504 [Puccinia graminis f. sp. tritici]